MTVKLGILSLITGPRLHLSYNETKLRRSWNTILPLQSIFYHWTLLRRPLRAKGPSIILCAKKWSLRAPQRRGSSHSGEGKNGRVQPITTERRGYKKIPLVGFQDLYKTDLQNSFRVNRVILRGFPAVVTQILGPILGFSLKVPGGILEFVLTSPGLEAPLLMFDVSYILASNRTHQDE
jgi:hypothetical protein